jgi:hypothetical protein
MKYLCVPSTSVPSERIFSKAGEILSKKRNRISVKHLNNLIFFTMQQLMCKLLIIYIQKIVHFILFLY